jgi:hypothetical protein
MEILIEYGPLVLLMLSGIFLGVVRPLVKAMAARPEEDGWDDAMRVIEELAPHVEDVKAWADPSNPAVPPAPAPSDEPPAAA